MPNLEAAKKDLRQTKKRTVRNSLIKTNIKDYIRQSRKAAEKKDLVKTEEYVNLAIKALDKALRKHGSHAKIIAVSHGCDMLPIIE